MNFVLGDLNKIRTEAPKTSPLYRQNMSKREILEQFIKYKEMHLKLNKKYTKL